MKTSPFFCTYINLTAAEKRVFYYREPLANPVGRGVARLGLGGNGVERKSQPSAEHRGTVLVKAVGRGGDGLRQVGGLDDLERKAQGLHRVARTVLHENSRGFKPEFDEVVAHRLRLADLLVRALSARNYAEGARVFAQVIVGSGESAAKHSRGARAFYAAAEHDNGAGQGSRRSAALSNIHFYAEFGKIDYRDQHERADQDYQRELRRAFLRKSADGGVHVLEIYGIYKQQHTAENACCIA